MRVVKRCCSVDKVLAWSNSFNSLSHSFSTRPCCKQVVMLNVFIYESVCKFVSWKRKIYLLKFIGNTSPTLCIMKTGIWTLQKAFLSVDFLFETIILSFFLWYTVKCILFYNILDENLSLSIKWSCTNCSRSFAIYIRIQFSWIRVLILIIYVIWSFRLYPYDVVHNIDLLFSQLINMWKRSKVVLIEYWLGPLELRISGSPIIIFSK